MIQVEESWNNKFVKDFQSMDGELSLPALLNHIRQNHPRLTNLEYWSIFESTGTLFNLGQNEIPRVIKSIGLGASLYLLTLKAFCITFFVLTLINVPVFMIFNSGHEQS